jgi:hypothetical protein
MGILSLCVVILGGAWWQSLGVRDDAIPPTGDSRLAGGLLPEASRVTPPGSTAIEASAIATTPAVRAEPDSPNTSGGNPADLIRTLPGVSDVETAGLGLPPLELQLISFSENPTDRFVFINGYQYRQGQRVQNGPMIVTIYSEGVVLRQGTRDFALLPN